MILKIDLFILFIYTMMLKIMASVGLMAYKEKCQKICRTKRFMTEWIRPPLDNTRQQGIARILDTLSKDAAFAQNVSMSISSFPTSIYDAQGKGITQRQNLHVVGKLIESHVCDSLNHALSTPDRPLFAVLMGNDQNDYDIECYFSSVCSEPTPLSIKFISSKNVILKNNMKHDLAQNTDMATKDTLIVWVEDIRKHRGEFNPLHMCYDPEKRSIYDRSLKGNVKIVDRIDTQHPIPYQCQMYEEHRHRAELIYIPKEYLDTNPTAIQSHAANVTLNNAFLDFFMHHPMYIRSFSCKKNKECAPKDIVNVIKSSLAYATYVNV
jgi:hypothetical protein